MIDESASSNNTPLGHRLDANFLVHLSHEFRTPLAGMKISLELLMENIRSLSTDEIIELLNSLHLSVSSLQRLIDNLMESSKIEAQQFSLRRQTCDFDILLAEAIRFVQPFLNRRHQDLHLDASLSFPTIYADPIRITQVLVNLLTNASKYSPVETPIDILMEQHENGLYIGVADRGPGVPEARRKDIFKQYVRLERDLKAHGTGIGLAVIKTIVEAHGGQVGVDGREGGGSVFWFTLPYEEQV